MEETAAEEAESVSQEEVVLVEARTDKVTTADARAAAVEPQAVPSMTSPAAGTLSNLQADADVWLSVLEEVALLREGGPPKLSYDEHFPSDPPSGPPKHTFVAHTLPFQALQLISQVCKAWRIDEATPQNARIWKTLCERRWPSTVQMKVAPCNHRALFKTLSQPRSRFEMALGEDSRPYGGPNVFGKEPIKFDEPMRELQKGFQAAAAILRGDTRMRATYTLVGGPGFANVRGSTLADVTLLVDIHSTGGAHLISHGIRGPPTVCLKYSESSARGAASTGDEVGFWQFVTPVPLGWHKVDKKVSCSLVNARLGEARLILDRQAESDCWNDMTKSIGENRLAREPFKKSYGGAGLDVPELEFSEVECSYPLLNIEEADGNLTISLYAVGAYHVAEGCFSPPVREPPLGLFAWLEPIRQSGLVPADPRRLPTRPDDPD